MDLATSGGLVPIELPNDIVEAYKLIDTAVDEVQALGTNIKDAWVEWFQDKQTIGSRDIQIPRQSRQQQDRTNVPG